MEPDFLSRRSFFKKAIQTALPFIATVAMISNPVILEAKSVTSQQCKSCMGRCGRNCWGSCEATCQNECGGCASTCHGKCYSCQGNCQGDCMGSCKESCNSSSKM